MRHLVAIAPFEVVKAAWWQVQSPVTSHLRQLSRPVTFLLTQCGGRGQYSPRSCACCTRQFVGMLRGDIHLEVLFGWRNCPDATEIHVHVKTVVDLLLSGAVAADLSALKPTPRHRCSDASRFAIHRHLEGCLEEAVTLRATRRQRTHRCLLQRLARLIKNERRNTRTITSPYGSPFIARKSWLSREIDQHVAG